MEAINANFRKVATAMKAIEAVLEEFREKNAQSSDEVFGKIETELFFATKMIRYECGQIDVVLRRFQNLDPDEAVSESVTHRNRAKVYWTACWAAVNQFNANNSVILPAEPKLDWETTTESDDATLPINTPVSVNPGRWTPAGHQYDRETEIRTGLSAQELDDLLNYEPTAEERMEGFKNTGDHVELAWSNGGDLSVGPPGPNPYPKWMRDQVDRPADGSTRGSGSRGRGEARGAGSPGRGSSDLDSLGPASPGRQPPGSSSPGGESRGGGSGGRRARDGRGRFVTGGFTRG